MIKRTVTIHLTGDQAEVNEIVTLLKNVAYVANDKTVNRAATVSVDKK